MAVYKRGYQRYNSSLTGRFTRFMALPRFAWERLFQQRLVVVLICVAMLWPFLCGIFIYLSNHSEFLRGADQGFRNFLTINQKFFAVFMSVQSIFALLLASLAGPGLIAPDLANNALPLYFSRPMSRLDYVLARLLVIVGMLSFVTILPGLILFVMQTGMGGWEWFSEYWYISTAMMAGFSIWILVAGLVALACSAYVKWRIIAGALVLAFYFILPGISEIVNQVFRVDWGHIFNPARSIYVVSCALLGTDPPRGPEWPACALMLICLVGLLALVLERKLRPVEVIG